jgi:hypothetical protein
MQFHMFHEWSGAFGRPEQFNVNVMTLFPELIDN